MTSPIESTADDQAMRNQINLEDLLSSRIPGFSRQSPWLRKLVLAGLSRLLRAQDINRFLRRHHDKTGFDFIDHFFHHVDFSYTINSEHLRRIPSTGRVLIVANHPMGALDGLSLLRMVGEVRPDVKIVANDILAEIRPMRALLLPVDNLGSRTARTRIDHIVTTLEQEQAVIIFPAGQVSRATSKGITDDAWNAGFLRIAKRANTPLLPVHVEARNTIMFYVVSCLNATLSMLMLPRQMFARRNQSITIRTGEMIAFETMQELSGSLPEKAARLREHVYRIAAQNAPPFHTGPAIIHAQDRKQLQAELDSSRELGRTLNGTRILLVDHRDGSAVLNELGRLRELTFRQVGEGTGTCKDIDCFDQHYRHVVLWNDDDLEIAGAYRLAESWRCADGARLPLYSESLFKLGDGMKPLLDHGIELGRSFVQPRYWGNRSLDHLWQGIGAYLRTHEHVRYMYGPVTITNSYPRKATDMLIWFYRHYYGDRTGLAKAKRPYVIPESALNAFDNIYCGNNEARDFAMLKSQLKVMNVSIPTLYKQYTRLCEPGGTVFCDFSIDPAFNHCIDGLLVVDIRKVIARKKRRYMGLP